MWRFKSILKLSELIFKKKSLAYGLPASTANKNDHLP